LISERARAGQRKARKQGNMIGRPKLSGMVVKKVLDLMYEGKSYQEILKGADLDYSTISSRIFGKTENIIIFIDL